MSSTVTPVLSLNSAVFTGGAAQDGYVLTWKNSGSAYQLLPASTGTITLTGDVTGTGTGGAATTVGKIQGNTVTSGALVAGNVLYNQ